MTEPAATPIEVKVTAPVGTILLNGPEQGNTLSRQTLAELATAIQDLHRDSRARAIVLTGAGDTFTTGHDLVEMARDHETKPDNAVELHQQWGDQADDVQQLLAELLEFPKPVIAAVNGPVAGLGVALLMASDMVLACDTAELSLPEAKQGLVAGLTAPLVAYRTNAAIAARLAVLGQTLEAVEAHRLGLYHEIVPQHLLWARAMELGSAAATASPQAVSLTKRLLMETIGEKLLTDLASGSIALATSRTTPAAEEGLKAAAEGREPVWD
ncbi:enoyl-CoA hydratase/isomerase family protein [Aeoliella mucimassa]|uniref:Putative enoyl-CoA hydratase echA8 n=1 Tax=Aeoliella mucimassa TaxID=2527972 RepID=A0A518ASV6_9BACT|nr:enoyl-CoA hydratase/isomerase family protein [Aeoliella mucimassa]QDU57804.1 putative enoyl-CoA hydratase echA8 [Aeoliella mucimassa]